MVQQLTLAETRSTPVGIANALFGDSQSYTTVSPDTFTFVIYVCAALGVVMSPRIFLTICAVHKLPDFMTPEVLDKLLDYKCNIAIHIHDTARAAFNNTNNMWFIFDWKSIGGADLSIIKGVLNIYPTQRMFHQGWMENGLLSVLPWWGDFSCFFSTWTPNWTVNPILRIDDRGNPGRILEFYVRHLFVNEHSPATHYWDYISPNSNLIDLRGIIINNIDNAINLNSHLRYIDPNNRPASIEHLMSVINNSWMSFVI